MRSQKVSNRELVRPDFGSAKGVQTLGSGVLENTGATGNVLDMSP